MPDQAFTGSLKPGVTLDKYEVREQVAAGGMAVIYKAYDPTLDRYVAIKQIAPHLALDEKFAVRFRTEAQTLARLSSSQANVVHVHELIQQDGQLYLVMEYVEGTTLRAMMDKGPIPFQTGLGIMLSVSLGLRAMHAQGIVHRDLTPNNIMMARDGALKITDFGLIGHSGGRTSLPMGTTKYMAPEMFTGAPVDPRADLYSLGMIAYEMFAGPEKFAEAFRDVLRDEKAQQVRWMHWHSNAALRAPPLKDLQPGIPPLVSKVVERLLDKDPSRRFASADQIVKWLRKIFVMNVQAKSVSVQENEAIEKEMEADTAAPVPAARAGGASAGAVAAESGEKTAPLPKAAMTWQRAVFWAAVVLLPLVLAAGGVIYWKYSEQSKRLGQASSAAKVARDLFERREFAAAAQAYLEIMQKYPDLDNLVTEADRHVLMARAEESLDKKEWERADAYANQAQEKDAPALWQSGFRNRFQKARDVEEKLAQAETAEKAGEFEKAKAVITDVMTRYPDLKLSDIVLRLQEKIELREYRARISEGNQAYANRDYVRAAALFEEARLKRETPEVLELLQKVTLATELTRKNAEAEQAAAAGRWATAAAAWADCVKLFPDESYRQKMNAAKAEALVAEAELLKENNVLDEATRKFTEALQFNPKHPKALDFLNRQGQAQKLAQFLSAGDEAKAKGDFEAAINSLQSARPLVDPTDAAALKAIDDKIAECKSQSLQGKSREALAQKDFAKAMQFAAEAQAVSDTQEVKDLIALIKKTEQYTLSLNLGKELLTQANYLKALAELQAAQKIEDTQEVRDLITECQYRRFMARANLLMNDRKYGEAKATFALVRRYRDTAEAQGREAEAARLLAAAEKAAQGGP